MYVYDHNQIISSDVHDVILRGEVQNVLYLKETLFLRGGWSKIKALGQDTTRVLLHLTPQSQKKHIYRPQQ